MEKMNRRFFWLAALWAMSTAARAEMRISMEDGVVCLRGELSMAPYFTRESEALPQGRYQRLQLDQPASFIANAKSLTGAEDVLNVEAIQVRTAAPVAPRKSAVLCGVPRPALVASDVTDVVLEDAVVYVPLGDTGKN